MTLKKYVVSILCLAVLMTGCSNQNNKDDLIYDENGQTVTENQKPNYKDDYKLNYSNLVDEDSQKEVSDKLEKSGVKKEYVSNFIKNVNTFNDRMKDMKGLSSGFVSSDLPQVEYDDIYGIDRWEELAYDFEDINCRVATFSLFRDFIESNEVYNGDSLNLAIDINTIENNPDIEFSKEDMDKFINLYALVKTKPNYSKEEHAKAIKDALSSRNIKIKENGKISIINVYLHDYELDELFVGHAGVLVEDGDELLFIEKYSPLTPFQASKFKNRKEVYSYLMDRLDRDETGKGVSPIIFENANEIKY